jgi:RecA-family ATPase
MANLATADGACKNKYLDEAINDILERARNHGPDDDRVCALFELATIFKDEYDFERLMAHYGLRFPKAKKLTIPWKPDAIERMRKYNRRADRIKRMMERGNNKSGMTVEQVGEVVSFEAYKRRQIEQGHREPDRPITQTEFDKAWQQRKAECSSEDWRQKRAKILNFRPEFPEPELKQPAAKQQDTKKPKPKTKQTAPVSLPFIDMSRWDETEPPKREWLIDDLIPIRQPALLSGEGAVGKSILLLQLLAASSLDRLWLDQFAVAHGPTLYFGAEDECDEIHRRLAAILEHYKAKFADLVAGGFKALAFAGENAGLAWFNRWGIVDTSPTFDRLYEECRALQPKCIVIDTVSDVFIGSEIDRAQVRQFGSLMRKLAIDSNATVILASHPSLTGISTGTGLSGSTQWHNTVRARAYFKKPDDKSAIDDGRRELEFHKNQYGPMSQTIALQWKAGLWLPATTKDKAAEIRRVETLFLDILQRLTAQGRRFSDKRGPTYAPTKFAEQPEAKEAKMSSKTFAEAMETLLASGIIRVVEEGRPSKRRSYLEEVPASERPYKVIGPAPGEDSEKQDRATDFKVIGPAPGERCMLCGKARAMRIEHKGGIDVWHEECAEKYLATMAAK